MVDTAKIKEHMPVLGSDGERVGTVDHMEGSNQIKLTKNDPRAEGKHHFIPVEWVSRVDEHVHLNKSCNDAVKGWKSAA